MVKATLRATGSATSREVQCNTRGTDNVNSGMGASNWVPSAAAIWYSPRIVPTGVANGQPLVYSNDCPGCSVGCWPMTPRPRTSSTRWLESVISQCRLTSWAGTVPVLVTLMVYPNT